MNTQRKSWLKRRSSGVLAHVSSLPGAYGIGNLGDGARRFIDFLSGTGFAYWQICPVGPTGYGDSPYQSFSTFGGNPYFIELKPFVDAGILPAADVAPLQELGQSRVDFGALYERFWAVLAKLARDADRVIGLLGGREAWDAFNRDHAHWLRAYTLFMGLKAHHGGRPWYEWAPGFRNYSQLDPDALPVGVRHIAEEQALYQFIFFSQWNDLRRYAHERGIGIIGDIPIFVAHDSADVWQHPEVFRVDASGRLLVSAGVPPDYFSEAGQYWGNPLYDWEHLRQTGYAWWMQRLGGVLSLFDIVRLDHFRAFANFWEIPGGAPDARQGCWVPGPGMAFFSAVFREFPDARIIAEDLGYIDEAVFRLKEDVGLPGMKVLQFGFGHDANNVNLPHFHIPNSVVYTGTHDNDTTCGWRQRLASPMREQVDAYFACNGDETAWPLVRAALKSVSRLAVVPLQDLMDRDSSARMNTPGKVDGNWQWRFTMDELLHLEHSRGDALRELNRLAGRTGSHAMQTDYSEAPSTHSGSNGSHPVAGH